MKVKCHLKGFTPTYLIESSENASHLKFLTILLFKILPTNLI